ncbi:CHAT domain-containing protein [Microbispora catharanthi]|uniref:CHAT domain-containing protein n=1 Tax=Microbispora catharanthi TaxID=1712871 RepID=UPI001378A08C|nr:CHAT domain-containing protein [Microbispora catharanthi]
MLAEYFVTERETFLFLLDDDADAPRTERIPLTRDTLRAHTTELVSALHAHGTLPADGPLSALTAPLAQVSAPGDLVWIVPHDTLHYLPFSMLHVDGAPLAARNPLCTTPSATVMRYCQAKHDSSRRRVLAYADTAHDRPLPRARRQAEELARIFGDDAVLRLGPHATSTALDTDLGPEPARIVHFGCHGTFVPESPLRSGITLADGDLTAERILNRSLRADLVTLSACESGVNARRPGDELVGLTRSLIYAGAASVLVTLWAVDELSASLLMADFYRELAAGAGKAVALQRAQNTLRSITGDEVIRRCEQAPGSYAEDIADVRFRCGDFTAARDAYSRLLDAADPDGDRAARFLAAETRSRWAASAADRSPDYKRRIYSNPYHWAAFVLVGDWR